jgi:dimethylargininase
VDIALTRGVSARLADCELSYVDRQPIDVALARTQHHQYQALLRKLGLEVIELPPLDDLPDAVFVEDTAVVVDEVAVLARPGAASRAPEVASIALALAPYRKVVTLGGTGTLDGGDVLRIERQFYVGLTRRTTAEGAAALGAELAPFGYGVTPVPVTGCLHLKSAASYLGEGRVLVHRPWFDTSPLGGLDLIDVPQDEGWGANVLVLGGEVVMAAGFPGTRALLQRLGLRTHEVPLTELLKAEAGVTCESIIFCK